MTVTKKLAALHNRWTNYAKHLDYAGRSAEADRVRELAADLQAALTSPSSDPWAIDRDGWYLMDPDEID